MEKKTDPEEVHSGSEKGMGTRIEIFPKLNPGKNTSQSQTPLRC